MSDTDLTMIIILHSIFSLAEKVIFVHRFWFIYSSIDVCNVLKTDLLLPGTWSELMVTVQLISCAYAPYIVHASSKVSSVLRNVIPYLYLRYPLPAICPVYKNHRLFAGIALRLCCYRLYVARLRVEYYLR